MANIVLKVLPIFQSNGSFKSRAIFCEGEDDFRENYSGRILIIFFRNDIIRLILNDIKSKEQFARLGLSLIIIFNPLPQIPISRYSPAVTPLSRPTAT
jgi:hypothetical protein